MHSKTIVRAFHRLEKRVSANLYHYYTIWY